MTTLKSVVVLNAALNTLNLQECNNKKYSMMTSFLKNKQYKHMNLIGLKIERVYMKITHRFRFSKKILLLVATNYMKRK